MSKAWIFRNTCFFNSWKKKFYFFSIVSDSLQPHGLYSPWKSPGQNTGVGTCSLLQGIFPTQGLNPGLPHCRRILYQLNHQVIPRIVGWVAYPFSSRSSWPRNRIGVSCIIGRFFTRWHSSSTHSSILAWKNSMDKGSWQAAVHGVTKSQTPLSNFHFHFSSYLLNISYIPD